MILPLFKKKSILLLIVSGLSTHSYVFAQVDTTSEESHFFENVRFGGSIGSSFSNNTFSAFLAPKAVYGINYITSAGIGLAGSYTNANNYTAHSISGSFIGLVLPIQNIQLSAEFEENYVS